jgi:hypothetical protein
MSENLQINKGVDLMLRRLDREPERSGLKVRQTFTLLSKIISFRFEFTWENRQ